MLKVCRKCIHYKSTFPSDMCTTKVVRVDPITGGDRFY